MGDWQRGYMHRTSNANDAGSNPASPTIYIYRWDRFGRKGQKCIVLVRGNMNSCTVEFEDKFQMVTSRNALKRFNGPVP